MINSRVEIQSIPSGASVKRDNIEQYGNASEDPVSSGVGKFVPSKTVIELRNKLIKFMEDHIYPVENEFYKLAQSSSRWTVHPEEERLKDLARKEGLWNLWIPVCVWSFFTKMTFLDFLFLHLLFEVFSPTLAIIFLVGLNSFVLLCSLIVLPGQEN